MVKSHRLTLTAHTAVVVHLDHAAHVWLFDPANFQRYRSTGQADGWGGTYDKTPVILRAPRAGTFHLVVDLGLFRGPLNYRVELRAAA